MNRAIAIPPMPATLNAPAYTPLALAARECFLRDAASAWARAGDAQTALLLARDADVQRRRHRHRLET
ncbi:hypothetical protein HN018_26750 (plasmid) [Lichenicola cladoniae]|uniref:ANR family transcriptional regulator n=1 Tax=Lichenicola cladoniae TaxID=1484109 RepID=A0A6M8HYX6_9PROT|nr:hypothetical protein [Lichenicola cladoniae]NPD66621.1 hypothetical protein [Acetobacteraceae bacterium]QKE93733.1 hypothetical protein HN018_26750 [Lichenicola cladoniae]